MLSLPAEVWTDPGRVLVTGATGFVGRGVVPALRQAGCVVAQGARSMRSAPGEDWVAYGEIGPATAWDEALEGVSTIIHLAGLAHLPDGVAGVERLNHVNVEGTERLARAAASAGVRRIVLMSSALVLGQSSPGRALRETDPPRPETPYALSKLRSEQRLSEIAASGGMEWVILRPPLVYGRGAGGNFHRLVRLARARVPLPLAAATAPRSFVGIDNLADAVLRCVGHAGARNQVFHVTDGEPASTAAMVQAIGAAIGARQWTPSVTPALLRAIARLVARERDFRRLFDPFELDIGKIQHMLAWHPAISLAEGVRRAVADD